MNRARPSRVRRIAAFLAIAVAASALSVAAPAAAAGVSGAFTVELQESVDSSHKIAQRAVELWTAGGSFVESGLTDLDGTFEFDAVLDGLEDYEVYVAPGDPYEDVSVDNMVAVTTNDQTINLVPVAGTVTGTISNWDSSLLDPLLSGDGTEVLLWRYDSGNDEWDLVSGSQLIYADWYRIAGVYDTEPYLASIHPYEPAEFYHTDSDGSPVSFFGVFSATGFAGVPAGNVDAGSVALIDAAYISGNISARDGSTPDTYIWLASDYPDFDEPAVLELTFTDPDGDYSAKVATGYTYLAFATDAVNDYYQLAWDDHLAFVCSCGWDYDSISVSSGATTTGIDFVLTPIDTSVMFDLYLSELDLANLPDELDLADVKVHLYKPVSGGWQEVDSRDSSDLGYSYVAGTTNGTYRLRFSIGSDWLPFTRYTDPDNNDHTVAASCYLDVTGASLGDYLVYDFLIDTETSSPACGAQSPVGTTTTTTGHKRTRVPADAAVVMPTPTATPTPTPTPTESATDPSATPAPTAEPEVSSPDFSWLIWLLVILGFLGLCSVAFFFFRRR